MITDTQSYGMVICDTLYAKAVTLPIFAGWTSRRTQQLPTFPGVLPYLGVYFIKENMGPDGDINAGEVRFITDLSVGFSIIVQNNDPVESEPEPDDPIDEPEPGAAKLY